VPSCRVERQAALPLLFGGRGPMLVAAKINGSPVSMVVDTGAQWTAITPDTMTRLQLPPDAWNGGLHRGVADSFSNHINAITRSFEVGGMTIEGRSLSVVPLSFGAGVQPPLAGLLGADFLYHFDLDIDLPHGALTLYRHAECGSVPPWAAAGAAIPLLKSAPNRLFLWLSVDGRPFRAILDTGATISLITRPNALRAGVSPATLERDPTLSTGGLGTQQSAVRLHEFASMQIGRQRFESVRLAVGGRVLGGGDMLLGLDFLRGRRVWVSYAARQMFIARP
jgi:predicted aspartyl protease